MLERPISALSILACPANGDFEDLRQIVKGGAEKMHEAQCSILGGHSVADDEIKFGYAVTGTVHPQRVKANAGARAGDALVLTKPIGTGVIATAAKRGIAVEEHVSASLESMLKLNRRACEEMLRFDVHGCTDITGFGLAGHAREMAVGSGVTIELSAGAIRFLPGAVDYARRGAIPAGLKNNREFVGCAVELQTELAPGVEELLYDPQTSGGLLISLADADAAALTQALPDAYRVGRVVARGEKAIRIV